MLAGQRLSPRHAGLCGVAVPSSRANMCWNISALLCFALVCFVIIADHYYSLIVIAAGFAPTPPSPEEVSMGCGKYSTEFFFSVTVLGGWHSLGCHGYLQGKAPLLRYRPFHL